METQIATTPFGRRSLTLGQIAAQLQVKRTIEGAGKPGSNHPAAVNKWQLYRTLTQIRERLGVSDRALSVLNALLSFHQETALSLPKPSPAPKGRAGESDEGVEDGDAASFSCDLIVFPSNKALGLRAHGMAPATLWRHLSALVEVGLIARRDSPNGKRYARKARDGGERFSQAFGFDLTPLVARAPEFEAMAEDVRRSARARTLTKERISLLRRDAGKLIALGLDEGLRGNWEVFRQRYMALMPPLRRLRNDAELKALAAALEALRDEVSRALETLINVEELKSNAPHNEEHHSNSNSQWSSDLEPPSKEKGRDAEPEQRNKAAEGEAEEANAYPLGLVLEACPDIRDYAPDGRVRNWCGFLDAARAVRPMIGISPDAFAEARKVLGDTAAHVAVATILQRSIHSSEAESSPGSTPGSTAFNVNGSPAILSAGGYLRALTERARAGEFALGPLLMALIGQRLKAKRGKTGAT